MISSFLITPNYLALGPLPSEPPAETNSPNPPDPSPQELPSRAGSEQTLTYTKAIHTITTPRLPEEGVLNPHTLQEVFCDRENFKVQPK